MTFLPIPSSTFYILKCGFDTPTQAILPNTLPTRREIRNNEKRFFFTRVPIRTHIGFDLVVLPHTNRRIQPFSRLFHEIGDWARRKPCVMNECFTRMFSADPKQIMPSRALAQG